MRLTLVMLCIGLFALSFQESRGVKYNCYCEDCKCTSESHCGCFSSAGCHCPEGTSHCGQTQGAGNGQNPQQNTGIERCCDEKCCEIPSPCRPCR